MEVPIDIYDYDGTQFVYDNERAMAEQERARAIGNPGNMNMNWH